MKHTINHRGHTRSRRQLESLFLRDNDRGPYLSNFLTGVEEISPEFADELRAIVSDKGHDRELHLSWLRDAIDTTSLLNCALHQIVPSLFNDALQAQNAPIEHHLRLKKTSRAACL